MKRVFISISLSLLFCIPMSAFADAIYVSSDNFNGFRSTGGQGIQGFGGWNGSENNGFSLTWNISTENTGSWDYFYTYSISGLGDSPLNKELSHWILEVTSGAETSDFNFLTADSDIESIEGPKTYTPEDGNSNPGLPGSIFGVKWDTKNDPAKFSISFYTDRAPVWGDFYAKDGVDGGSDTYAYNTGFGLLPDAGDGGYLDWIARPNGGPAPVPEPATMLLFGTGLAGIASFRKRKNR